MKGGCRNCHVFFISVVENKSSYDMQIVHQYNVDIVVLTKISLYESAGSVSQ